MKTFCRPLKNSDDLRITKIRDRYNEQANRLSLDVIALRRVFLNLESSKVT